MGIGALLGVFALAAPLVSAQYLSAIRDYSVIVAGNFSTNSDVYGRTVVGGNLNVSNSANFGTGLQNAGIPKSSYTVRVGGSLSSGNPIQIQAGSLEIGGSTNGRKINFNGGGSITQNSSDDYRSLYNNLVIASSALSAFSANSTFTKPGSQPAAFTFIANPNSAGLAIFNVSASELFGNSKVQQIDLIANGATDFLFNVSGTSVNFDYGNLTGIFTNTAYLEKIVWNFYEAETINFGSKSMGGLILAPNADITASGQIRGTVVAENLTTTAKIDTPPYTGVFTNPSLSPLPIPEPSSSLTAAFGLGMLMLVRRRD